MDAEDDELPFFGADGGGPLKRAQVERSRMLVEAYRAQGPDVDPRPTQVSYPDVASDPFAESTHLGTFEIAVPVVDPGPRVRISWRTRLGVRLEWLWSRARHLFTGRNA